MNMRVLLLFLVSTILFSQDRELNIQGVLRQPSGKAVADGDYTVEFNVYTSETGGTSIKRDSRTITIYNGVYSSPIDISALAFDRQYWVGLSFNGSAELEPRVKLSTSSYAMALVGENNKFPSSGTVRIGDSLKVSGALELSGQLILNNGQINGALTLGDRLKFSGSSTIQRGNLNITSHDLGLYAARGWVRFVTNDERFNWYSDAGSNPNGGTPLMTLHEDGKLQFGNTGTISQGGKVEGINDLGLYSFSANRYMRFVTNNGRFKWYTQSGTGGIGANEVMSLNQSGDLNLHRDMILGRDLRISGALTATNVFGDWGKPALNLTRSGVITFASDKSESGTSDMGLYSKSGSRDMRFVSNNRSFLWFTSYSTGRAASHNNGWRMKLWNYGNLEVKRDILTRELFETSDLRLKKEVNTLNHTLKKILQLRGVSFFWKDDKTKTDQKIGFIAQEIEKIYPELVNTDSEGYKSVSYANMTAVLVEALKEQNQEIVFLKKALNKLKSDLKSSQKIAKRVEKLELLMAKILEKNDALTAAN